MHNTQAYVKAISSGVENIQEVLLSPEAQKQLVSFGPRLVSHTTKARKTIDTEDTDLKCLAEADGTLVTEKKQTTEHEELVDDQLPEEDDHSTGSRERINHTVCDGSTSYCTANRCFFVARGVYWPMNINIKHVLVCFFTCSHLLSDSPSDVMSRK